MGYAARLHLGRKWTELPVSDELSEYTKRHGIGKIQCFRSGSLQVLVSDEDGRHLSISRPDRYPSWDEIAAAKRQFFPSNVEAVIVLPAEENWINLHPNCFHVWQSKCQQEGR